MEDGLASYAMFLRGINVGGHRKVSMAELRALVADLTGDTGVRSYIASGNVVFRSEMVPDDLIAEIGSCIQKTFGFQVPLLLLDAATMHAVLASCPHPEVPGNLLHAYLCYDAPQLNKDGVAALKTVTEEVSVVDHTVWLYAPDGVGRSKLAAKLEGLLGVQATARNLNTVRKMMEMLGN